VLSKSVYLTSYTLNSVSVLVGVARFDISYIVSPFASRAGLMTVTASMKMHKLADIPPARGQVFRCRAPQSREERVEKSGGDIGLPTTTGKCFLRGAELSPADVNGFGARNRQQ